MHGPNIPLAPFESALDFWNCCARIADLWWTRHGGASAPELSRKRFESLLAYAREYSPFYRRLYAHLPAKGVAPSQLPAVTKRQLMANFDDWATDRRVRLDAVNRFVADRKRVGKKFAGHYLVWKSSGSTGTPGIFLQDNEAMAVYDALVASRFDPASLGAEGTARLLAGGGRAAIIVATEDHFASITSWERVRRTLPGLDARSFSVLMSLDRMVLALNDFQPAFLAAYPSVLALLALERAAGRLRFSPARLWSGGEYLAPAVGEAIQRAFGCPVMNEYGASECLSIAHGCRAGWMHVNSEWVLIEGVDDRGRATLPGEVSHTALVTNLANRVQPIIRYDLGDRIVHHPGTCACGDPSPAIRVEGRTDHFLRLRTKRGEEVRLPPLAVATVMEDCTSVQRMQIAQVAPDHLALRFDAGCDKERAVAWKAAEKSLREYLAEQGLRNVRLTLDPQAPRVDARSGKLHAVIDESAAPRKG
jgi:phenylacetate-CoA ligase